MIYKVFFTDGSSLEIQAANTSEARLKASNIRTQPIANVIFIR